jgi:hypothetical protein
MNKTIPIVLVFALLAVGMVAAVVNPDTVVTGTIYKSDGTTLQPGAAVDVNCNGNMKSTTSDASDATYTVVYPVADCAPTNTVTVTATFDSASGHNTGVVCGSEICDKLNVALVDVSIPEFATFGLIAAALAGLGIVAFRRR